ncbi:MAG TPA: glycosyltransferase family 1 protein [Thermoanaerobaculia bacterium]
MIRIGIDASNLRGGGGVTHLVEVLRTARPEEHGISAVTVWSGSETGAQLPSRPWLRVVCEPELDGSLGQRLRWQRTRLGELARAACDLLFVPGGTYTSDFRPVVAMCQNMLPFDLRERARFGLLSKTFIRLSLLHFVQLRAFRKADGVIFLSELARERVLGNASNRVAVVPHGVSDAFRREPREARPLDEYSFERPFRFLYTSIIDMYKHQSTLAEAVMRLREEGMPVALDLVGPSSHQARRLLDKAVARDRHGVIQIRGNVPYGELPATYEAADAFVFASTCENMPNILLEAMAAGLPIACSRREPMPRFLGDGGIYFEPTDVNDTAAALRRLATDHTLRARLAATAFTRAQTFSWDACARQTFEFLANVAVAARQQ